MPRWRPDAKVFDVVVSRNPDRKTNTSCVPKPVLDKLGNPDRLRFIIRGDKIVVTSPD